MHCGVKGNSYFQSVRCCDDVRWCHRRAPRVSIIAVWVCSAQPVYRPQVPLWGLPVPRHAAGVGGIHAEVHAHQGHDDIFRVLNHHWLLCELKLIFFWGGGWFCETDHRLPSAVPAGSVWDVGGPGADLPAHLRGRQQRERAQPSGPLRHGQPQPQRYLLLVHRDWWERTPLASVICNEPAIRQCRRNGTMTPVPGSTPLDKLQERMVSQSFNRWIYMTSAPNPSAIFVLFFSKLNGCVATTTWAGSWIARS